MISLSQLSQGPINQPAPATPPMDYSKMSWDDAVKTGTPQPSSYQAGGLSSIPGDIASNIENIPSSYSKAMQGFSGAMSNAGTQMRSIAERNNPTGQPQSVGAMANNAIDSAGAFGHGIMQAIGSLISPIIGGIGNVTSDVGTTAQANYDTKGGMVDPQKLQAATKNFLNSPQGKIITQAIVSHPNATRIIGDLANASGGALALSATPEDLASGVTGTIDAAKGAAGDAASAVSSGVSNTIQKILPDKPDVPPAPTPEQQALTDAQIRVAQTQDEIQKAIQDKKDALIQIQKDVTKAQTNAQKDVTKAQTNAQKDVTKAQTNAEINAQNAMQDRQTATHEAVQGVKEINTQAAAHKATLGEQFASDASKLEKTKPNFKLNLTNDQVKGLNSLKEGKNFVLPKSLDLSGSEVSLKGQEVNLGPNVKGQLEQELGKMGSEKGVSLSPTQTQDLLRELNRSTYKQMADGTHQIDYQRIGITNDIKNSASKTFGKKWDNIYSRYAQGRTAIDKIDSFVNLDPRATAADLNKQLQTILDQSKTPEGRLLLEQSLNEYKKISGIDLSNPTKAIQQIADKDVAVETAQKDLERTQKQGQNKLSAVQKESQNKLSAVQKESQNKLSAAQKDLERTQKQGQNKLSAVQKEVAKAQDIVDKINSEKLTPLQKVTKIIAHTGGGMARYGLRYFLIRELFTMLTKK